MKKKSRRRVRAAGRVLFASYLAAAVYLLFFAESYGRGTDAQFAHNLIPFREIRRFLSSRDILGERAVFLNVYGNVLLFVPFGAFAALLTSGRKRFLRVLFSGMTISLCVETAQLVSRRGSFDIDDVILNTMGTVAGYAVFLLCRAAYRYREGKR